MLSGRAAIVGIGAIDFCKNSGRSELRLAAEAVLDALDDAGLAPADVDGLVTFTMDSNTEVAVARAAGIGELKFFSKIHYGGGAPCATIQQALRPAWRIMLWRIGLSTSARECGSARCRLDWSRTPIRRVRTTRSCIRTGCPRRRRRSQ